MIDQISGTGLERRLAVLFRAQGYAVTHTGTAGDYGADLVPSKAGTRTLARANRVELWDRGRLVAALLATQPVSAAARSPVAPVVAAMPVAGEH